MNISSNASNASNVSKEFSKESTKSACSNAAHIINQAPRIPYENRTNWMANLHYQYGKKTHLHDIDSINMWIEHTSGNLAALAEFKNQHELIEPYKYRQLITLADNSNIPCYIVVGYEHGDITGKRPCYVIIPLNEKCKKMLQGDKQRWMSEQTYIKFLHHIRKLPLDPTCLEGKGETYNKELNQPNVRGLV